MSTCLKVENLTTCFKNRSGEFLPAVDDVSFSISSGEVLALVGESGCGKSVTSLSIMGLLDRTSAQITTGRVMFGEVDLVGLKEKQFNKIRGCDLTMVFQDPMTSLNPVFRVGEQVAEVLRIHKNCSWSDARRQSIEMLRIVKIPEPEQRYRDYPHQLSGGLRQRVMIAMALACRPRLLIADEPTTALDVTIQAEIMKLLQVLQLQFEMSILFITHDLGVVRDFGHRVLVMYGGTIVEESEVGKLFSAPQHPYTLGLIGSLPILGQKKRRLTTIPGQVPVLGSKPSGCAFRDRCSRALERCATDRPHLQSIRPKQSVACWNPLAP